MYIYTPCVSLGFPILVTQPGIQGIKNEIKRIFSVSGYLKENGGNSKQHTVLHKSARNKKNQFLYPLVPPMAICAVL